MKLTCKEASVLVSAAQDRRLTLIERVQLRLHLFICIACSRFATQVEFLRRVARQAGRASATEPGMRFPADARQRVVHRLRQEQRSDPSTRDV